MSAISLNYLKILNIVINIFDNGLRYQVITVKIVFRKTKNSLTCNKKTVSWNS